MIEGSVTHWIHQLLDREEEAAQQLWNRYFQRLVGLAQAKLQREARRLTDPEDIALSVLDSFYRGVADRRFPELKDRDNLWRLLIVITARKILNLQRDQHRLKRGGRQDRRPQLGDEIELEQIIGREPTPEFVAEASEECQRMLAELGDDQLRRIALLKLEGFTNNEIANQLTPPRTPRTVERKLELIRTIWEKRDCP